MIPTADAIIASLLGKVFPAIRSVVDDALAGVPEEQREAFRQQLEAKILAVVEAKIVPAMIQDVKDAIVDLAATGHGPAGFSPTDHVV